MKVEGFQRCSHCEGPECVAWDFIAWDCCNITGADHVVSREELLEAVAMGKSQALMGANKTTTDAGGVQSVGGGL